MYPDFSLKEARDRRHEAKKLLEDNVDPNEVAIVESDRKNVKLPGISRVFHGFNRNPFLASFTVENTDILLANCHLLYGQYFFLALKSKE